MIKAKKRGGEADADKNGLIKITKKERKSYNENKK